jgi:predicted enzyme related to lactoylglutathione lyase
MGHPVAWFEVQAKDPERQQSFYADLFDWKIDTNNPMGYGMVDTGAGDGAGIQGGIGGLPEGAPSNVTWYVQVPDPEEHLKKAEELGGKRLMGPMDVPEGPTIAHFADPEGNVVGLFTPPS